MMNETLPTHNLLQYIRTRFYKHAPQTLFHRDRRMLLYALTWPAAWLDERALRIPPRRYETLMRQRLDAIAQHGDPARYQHYFPRYLLKAIQDWFAWHGDDLYDELKHVRNHIPDIIALLQERQTQHTPDIVTPLAQAHAVLERRCRRKKQHPPEQMTLF